MNWERVRQTKIREIIISRIQQRNLTVRDASNYCTYISKLIVKYSMMMKNLDFNESSVLKKYETTQAISDVLRVQGGPREGVREIETNQLRGRPSSLAVQTIHS